MKNFRHNFHVILGSIFVKILMLLVVKTLHYLNTLTRKGVFTTKGHQNFDENRSQNHMKIMSKKNQFFISCCKCIFWCWWARGVYGNVSRVLQTRKTTNFCTVFRIIHYNRDLNTNAHLPLPDIPASCWVAPEQRRKNDLLKKLFGLRGWASNMFWSWWSCNFL